MYTVCGSSYAKIEQGEVAVTDHLLTIHLVRLSVDSTRSLCAKLAASMHDCMMDTTVMVRIMYTLIQSLTWSVLQHHQNWSDNIAVQDRCYNTSGNNVLESGLSFELP